MKNNHYSNGINFTYCKSISLQKNNTKFKIISYFEIQKFSNFFKNSFTKWAFYFS